MQATVMTGSRRTTLSTFAAAEILRALWQTYGIFLVVLSYNIRRFILLNFHHSLVI